MKETTVLFPGGFKPLTGAHLALAQRYAESPNVERVIMLIGPKERDGVSRQDSDEIFRLINTNPKIELRSTDFNSPIMAAYEFLFALPQDDMGTYAMAASRKGDDYARTMSFGSNVEKYKTIGDKKGRKIPPGVDINPMEVDVEPLTYEDGQPISASTIRQAIVNNDYETFTASYPGTKEAILKNIWQMLNGVQEATFSKEWWGNALAEDIEEVIEGYQTPDLANAHTAKMKKLRKYLDASQGKEFAYDFKKFKKTVFGVKLTESVLQENYITRSELSQIEAAADSFFSQYGIDVDMQGQFTHFFERLNDPRNDSPINMDELEDMFRKLAQEHGSRIQRQIELERPSAVASDLESDIHMPFMLKWDVKNKTIDLIPRTIKKQRRDWRVNNPNDIHYKLYAEGMLTEGGAAGHMNHPFDSNGLTFNDMKEIVARALQGRLDIEEAVTEKTDGQNIQVTWKDGQIGFSRGIKTRINPLSVTDIQDKFEGRGPVSDAFGNTADDLSAAFKQIPADTLNGIFKNGRVFANMEIIYPATQNVIAYETAVLQFHNLVEYDIEDKGQVIETDLSGGGVLQKIIQDANAHLQKTFSFIPPNKIQLGQIEDFEDKQDAFFAEIDSLKNQFGLKETDVVSEYHKAWWKDVIREKAYQMDYEIPEDILELLTYRWALNDKSTNITKIKKLIDNPEFLEWVILFDKKDFKAYQKQNIEPFESIFLRLGVVVLKNIKNYLAANPKKVVQQIKRDLLELIKELQTSDDPNTLKKLETELKKIQRIGGFDSIVPTEGIVFTYGGNTYKLTGSFAPVNQILGVLKYAR